MASFEKKEEVKVVSTNYTFTLDHEEVETLFIILAEVSSADVFEKMSSYGYKLDEKKDSPYALYELFRDALGRDRFGY